MKNLRYPLLRLVVAAALSTAITWLGGLLFGPMSETRARQLAERMSGPAPQLVAARPGSPNEGRRSPSAPAS
jgi:hypothetical protein